MLNSNPKKTLQISVYYAYILGISQDLTPFSPLFVRPATRVTPSKRISGGGACDRCGLGWLPPAVRTAPIFSPFRGAGSNLRPRPFQERLTSFHLQEAGDLASCTIFRGAAAPFFFLLFSQTTASLVGANIFVRQSPP
jgi:hypothetical protein